MAERAPPTPGVYKPITATALEEASRVLGPEATSTKISEKSKRKREKKMLRKRKRKRRQIVESYHLLR